MNTQDSATLPAPVIKPLGPQSKWEREYEAFNRLLPQLLAAHRGQYVAIHDGQVVDCDYDQVALLSRFYNKHGYVEVHTGFVAEQPPVHRIPHYRLHRHRPSS